MGWNVICKKVSYEWVYIIKLQMSIATNWQLLFLLVAISCITLSIPITRRIQCIICRHLCKSSTLLIFNLELLCLYTDTLWLPISPSCSDTRCHTSLLWPSSSGCTGHCVRERALGIHSPTKRNEYCPYLLGLNWHAPGRHLISSRDTKRKETHFCRPHTQSWDPVPFLFTAQWSNAAWLSKRWHRGERRSLWGKRGGAENECVPESTVPIC